MFVSGAVVAVESVVQAVSVVSIVNNGDAMVIQEQFYTFPHNNNDLCKMKNNLDLHNTFREYKFVSSSVLACTLDQVYNDDSCTACTCLDIHCRGCKDTCTIQSNACPRIA